MKANRQKREKDYRKCSILTQIVTWETSIDLQQAVYNKDASSSRTAAAKLYNTINYPIKSKEFDLIRQGLYIK